MCCFPHSVSHDQLFVNRRAVLRSICALSAGFLKWYSRLYRNQGSLLFGPGRFDWGDQIIVVTGGTCPIVVLYDKSLIKRYRFFWNW